MEWAEPDVTPQEVAFAPILDPVAPEVRVVCVDETDGGPSTRVFTYVM